MEKLVINLEDMKEEFWRSAYSQMNKSTFAISTVQLAEAHELTMAFCSRITKTAVTRELEKGLAPNE